MPRLAADLIQRAWDLTVRHGTLRDGSRRANGFACFGAQSQLVFPTTVLFGEHRIEIGARTVVGPHATLSAGMPDTDDGGVAPIVSIGDRCMLGKGIGIVGHERVEIGDDVFTGHYVYVTDQNHGYEDLSVPVGLQLWNNAPVSIGSGSWLGHGAVVLPGTRLGRHTVVAAGAVVTGEHPDNCVLAGVPARIVRRHDGDGWIRTGPDVPAG